MTVMPDQINHRRGPPACCIYRPYYSNNSAADMTTGIVRMESTVVKAKISDAYAEFLLNNMDIMVIVVAVGQAVAIRVV